MTNYLELHKEKKREMADLFTRMKDDNDLITNVDYVMKDAGNPPKKIANVVNITGNRPAVFAAFVEASLNRADEKLYVESDDESIDKAEIESAIKGIFEQANLKRRQNGKVNIEPYIDQQNCRRGRSMARIIIQEDKEGELDIDITPWDTRYATYELGVGRLAWGAYETVKTRAEIESEAWTKNIEFLKSKKEFTISDKTATTVDIWTPEGEVIYVNDKQVFEQPHDFGITPLALQVVPIGSMLADEGNIKYEGESIFFLIRHLIPEFNRLVSIMQTHNMRSVKGAIQQILEAGQKPSDYDEVTAMGAITAVTQAGGISPIEYNDIKQSAILLLQQISKMIDDGSLSPIMLGDLPGAMSAVALIQVEQGQGQVFMPRLGARGLLKQQLAEMGIAQIVGLGLSTIELGMKGHKKKYKVSKLEGEYTFSYTYANKSPETDYARLSMARAYKGVLDDLTILSDILKRDDPEGDLNKIRRQGLRELSPTLQIYDGLMALFKMYEDGDESVDNEIDIVEAELGVDLDSILAGKLPPAPEPQPVDNSEVLPVTTNTGRTSAQKASDLRRTPITEVKGE